MTGANLEILDGELLELSGGIEGSASALEGVKGFQGATSAAVSSIPGASSCDALRRAGSALDREIDRITGLLRGAARDVADLDAQFTVLDEQHERAFASVSTQPEW